MPEIIDTPDFKITIDDRPSGDGQGTARTVTYEPKPGTVAANQNEIVSKAKAALTANVAYLALQNPTNAQNVAQLERLTRQTNAIIKLLLNLLSDTEGT